jgi:DNA polymerase I-like protein with 3'-5' exonuclease and polymerase domains
VQSALYGSAFAQQAANMRAAGNHVIQSTGADITKRLQAAIWGLQPAGVGEWLVMPFNVHDEVMAPSKPEVAPALAATVSDFIAEHRALEPLIEMAWKQNLNSWGEK